MNKVDDLWFLNHNQIKIPMQTSEEQSRFVEQTIVFQRKWLGIKHISFTVRGKQFKDYQTAYRPTRTNQQHSADGAEIIPILKTIDNTLQLIMIANFRPPIGKFCLQFPAGLLDSSNFQQNALRQLKEETGYIAEKVIKLPTVLMHCDPWKSSEGGFLFIGIINQKDPNHQVKRQLESAQNIRVLRFKIDEQLPQKVNEFIEKNNYVIHSKLWTFIIGLSYQRFLIK